MKAFILLATLLSATFTHAALPPAYDNLVKIEAVVATMLRTSNGSSSDEDLGKVVLHSIKMVNQSTGVWAEIDLGNNVCQVFLTPNPTPPQPGWAGPTSYTGQIQGQCKHYESFAKVATLPYSLIRKSLKIEARKGVIVKAFRVMESAKNGLYVQVVQTLD
ncbi:MAG: hypothetical protein H7061_03670 [Bdellovibrionaceae bacterium]|nr:hypothetical protein [Bdellovibrio sp.]